MRKRLLLKRKSLTPTSAVVVTNALGVNNVRSGSAQMSAAGVLTVKYTLVVSVISVVVMVARIVASVAANVSVTSVMSVNLKYAPYVAAAVQISRRRSSVSNVATATFVMKRYVRNVKLADATPAARVAAASVESVPVNRKSKEW